MFPPFILEVSVYWLLNLRWCSSSFRSPTQPSSPPLATSLMSDLHKNLFQGTVLNPQNRFHVGLLQTSLRVFSSRRAKLHAVPSPSILIPPAILSSSLLFVSAVSSSCPAHAPAALSYLPADALAVPGPLPANKMPFSGAISHLHRLFLGHVQQPVKLCPSSQRLY